MAAIDFESLLKQVMGLDAASIGSSAVESAVKSRLAACRIDDVQAYWERLSTSATELQALIEAVIVPETWFFRDREAYTALARVANEDWLPSHPERIMRLLSLPCSSGEEPYSMAIALLNAGLPATRFRIDAVDISTQVLAYAQWGEYGKNSFRGADLAFRDRYFEKTGERHRLSDTVRRCVQFQQGNLFAEDFLPGAGIYDSIFCRNLLIYFDRPTQDRAVQLLQRLLKPEGVLFVGPSECGLLLSHQFVSAKVPMAFAFRRGASVALASAAAPARPKTAAPAAARKSSTASPATPIRAPRPNPPVDSPSTAGSALDEATRLADQGRLADAAKCCEEHLRKHGPSVQIFYLMGLIRAAAGELVSAGQYYRKALYLDPTHYDTLIHFALLLGKQGDAAGAQVLRDRLLRLRQKSA